MNGTRRCLLICFPLSTLDAVISHLSEYEVSFCRVIFRTFTSTIALITPSLWIIPSIEAGSSFGVSA